MTMSDRKDVYAVAVDVGCCVACDERDANINASGGAYAADGGACDSEPLYVPNDSGGGGEPGAGAHVYTDEALLAVCVESNGDDGEVAVASAAVAERVATDTDEAGTVPNTSVKNDAAMSANSSSSDVSCNVIMRELSRHAGKNGNRPSAKHESTRTASRNSRRRSALSVRAIASRRSAIAT